MSSAEEAGSVRLRRRRRRSNAIKQRCGGGVNLRCGECGCPRCQIGRNIAKFGDFMQLLVAQMGCVCILKIL